MSFYHMLFGLTHSGCVQDRFRTPVWCSSPKLCHCCVQCLCCDATLTHATAAKVVSFDVFLLLFITPIHA